MDVRSRSKDFLWEEAATADQYRKSTLYMCAAAVCVSVCVCVSEKREPAGKEERRASVWRVGEIVNRRL